MSGNKSRLLPVFLAVAAVSILSTLIVYWMGLRVAWANQAVSRSHEVDHELQATLSTLKDAETGQRGYLLTGNPDYLEPYHAAVGRIDEHLARLDQWARAGQLSPQSAGEIAAQTRRKLAELEQTIQLRRDKGPEAALAIVNSNAGKRIMDELRGQVAQVERQVNAQAAAGERRRDASTRLRTTVTALLSVVTLVFLLWAFRRIRQGIDVVQRQNEQLAQQQESLRESEAALARQNEELTQQSEELAQQNEELTQQNEELAQQAEELERQRQAIHESESRLRVIFDNAGVGILEADGDDRFIAANDYACRILGYPRQQLLTMSVQELTWPEDRAQSDQINASIHQGRQDQIAYEKRYTRADGTPLWAHSTVSAVRDAEGRWVCSIGTVEDISERKRAEEALRRSEEQLRAAALAAEIGAWSWVPGTSQVVVSANWRRLFGIAPDAPVTFETWRDALHPDDRERAVRELNAASEERRDFNVEYRLVRPDGSMRWVIDRGRASYDAAGRAVDMAGINLDITDRKKVEAERQRLAEQRQLALEAAELGAWDYQFETGDVFWDERCRNMWGISAGGRIDYAMAIAGIHPEDRAATDQAVKRALAGSDGGAYHQEFRVVWPDGSLHWVASHGRVFFEGEGSARRAVRFIGANIEVTERMRAEEALKESERRFRTMADAIPQLAWIANADGWIHWYNRRWYEYTGTTPQQMEGWGWQSVHDPNTLPAVLEEWKTSIATGEPFDMTFPLRGADGVFRPFLTRGMPLKDSQGRVMQWFGTNTDVSEQKAAEEALAAAKRSAEQARAAAESANKAKDHFLAVLSHELRTPLMPVLACVSMLQSHGRFDAETREHLAVVRRNVELEARLIDDLLDVTRIARGKVELDKRPVDLCEVVRRAVEVCKPDIEVRKLEFTVSIEGGPYVVEADAARLQQVFWNLLKNAVKFTPVGGCVGIRCRGEGACAKSTGNWQLATGNSAINSVVVEVSDSGIGIEPEAMERIFNAFEQGERSMSRQFGGLGLGLTISKAMVEMHGGTIVACSAGRNQGATFRVRLPLTSGSGLRVSGPEMETPGTRRPEPGTQALRILLVEDHGDTAKIMRRLLEGIGHQVESAADVATALKLAGEGRFDLLLSDLGLPDGSGLDLMRTLRSRGSQIVGIAVSGFGQEQDVAQSHAVGFAAHLTKPISLPRLEQAIAAVITP